MLGFEPSTFCLGLGIFPTTKHFSMKLEKPNFLSDYLPKESKKLFPGFFTLIDGFFEVINHEVMKKSSFERIHGEYVLCIYIWVIIFKKVSHPVQKLEHFERRMRAHFLNKVILFSFFNGTLGNPRW